MARQQVLWLSRETPDRHGQGGQRRQFFQIHALRELGHRVHVVTPRSPQDDRSLRQITTVDRYRQQIRGRQIPGTGNYIKRKIGSDRWDRMVLAHGESLEMLDPGCDHPPLLVDLHNVYSAWNKALGWDSAATREQRVEARALGEAQAVAVCSAAERARLEAVTTSATPVIVAPHGVDPGEWPEQRWDRSRPVVTAFGTWSWLPNQRGLQWFLSEVWPPVRARVPAAEFRIAGVGLDWLPALPEGVAYVGKVADLPLALASATVVVTPVYNGAGASMKFAESLASGARVVATPDAASAAPGSPALVSDAPGQWVDEIVAALQHRGQQQAPSAERRYALDELTWQQMITPIARWLSS